MGDGVADLDRGVQTILKVFAVGYEHDHAIDAAGIDEGRKAGIDAQIVLNKADKLSRSQQIRAVREASQKLARDCAAP